MFQIYLLLSVYLGGVPYFLVMMSFEVVSLAGGGLSGCTAVVVYLCDGKLDVLVFAVARWEMFYCCYFCIILVSLAAQWWAIFMRS